MVTISYEALNSLVHEVADAIEKATGIGKEVLDLYELNDAVVGYLGSYGVQFEDDVPTRATNGLG